MPGAEANYRTVMERRPSTPSWRASLGVCVAVITAVLLAVAIFQEFRLNAEAGASVGALNRERVAVGYEEMLYPLTVAMSRYRLNMELQAGQPPFPMNLRGQIDAQMRAATTFTHAHDVDLDTLAAWNTVRSDWAKARTVRAHYSGRVIDKTIADLVGGVLYHVEDTSGWEYEPNKFAQDLGDVAFARVPAVAEVALHTDLMNENAIAQGAISIPDRIRLARRIGSLTPAGGDLDFSGDDWPLILSRLPALHMGTAAEGVKYRADSARLFAAGKALADMAASHVVMRSQPAGSPAQSRRLTRATMNALDTLNADLFAMLNASLSSRIVAAQARNNYAYAITIFGAALLVGLMLLVAEVTARRDRTLLRQAKQESEHLSAELARQTAERALRLSEAQFRAVFDGAALGIAVMDRSGRILDSNAVFRNVYGESGGGVLEGHEGEFAELMRGERDLFEFEQHVMTPGGQEAWTDSTVSLVNDETGNPYFAICMFRDLTELKRSERRMLHDMTHDTLTGLPNRALFETKVREQFAEAKARPQSSFAVLFVDLDRFKDINESLGHDAGDFVISQVAHRLRSAIEAADVVARLGSDEFAVLVRSLPDVLHVEVIARRVLTALAKPVALGSRSIFISASVGIALASTSYQRGEDVMRDADIAMRYAKSGGGGRFAVFDSKMHARAEKRLQLTTDLRLALEHGEFDLLYQPIVRIADGELFGCEALLRWNHPTEGVMQPMDFMPLAEQTALAVPIGRFVLRTACRQALPLEARARAEDAFPG